MSRVPVTCHAMQTKPPHPGYTATAISDWLYDDGPPTPCLLVVVVLSCLRKMRFITGAQKIAGLFSVEFYHFTLAL